MAHSILKDFKNVVLCEDIRQEKNNKHILIGVYSGDLIFTSFPAEVRLTFYIEYLPAATGHYDINFRLRVGKKKILSFIVKAEVDDPLSIGVLPIPIMMYNFKEETILLLEVSVNESNWKQLITKKITQGKVSD